MTPSAKPVAGGGGTLTRWLGKAADGGWVLRLGLVTLLWAVLYLPGMTTLEIDGDEARRIYPAMTMLATGEWAVPVFAGEHYFRKPPMFNWLIAGSIRLCGGADEFSVRLPAALGMLLFALAAAGLPSAWLDRRQRFLAALIFLTSVGALEMGRMAEINGWYTAVTGIAILLWANAYAGGRGGFRLWLPPALALGFGLLLKGPLVLLFYYVTVLAVLWRDRALRKLAEPGHWLSAAVMMGIFLAWYLHATGDLPDRDDGDISGTWTTELLYRLDPRNLDAGKWIRSVFGSLFAFAPWLFFLPQLWIRADEPAASVPNRGMDGGGRRALVTLFSLINLMPATKPRYLMPAYSLASLLLARHLDRPVKDWMTPWWRRFIRLAVAVGAVAGVGALLAMTLLRAFPRLAASRAFLEPVGMAFEAMGTGGILLALGAGAVALAGVFLRLDRDGPDPTGLDFRIAPCLWGTVTVTLFFCAFVLPVRQQKGESRTFASQVHARVPATATLRVYRVNLGEAFFFYLRNHTEPMTKLAAADPAGHTGYWLVSGEGLDQLAEQGWTPQTLGEPFIFDEMPYHVVRWETP